MSDFIFNFVLSFFIWIENTMRKAFSLNLKRLLCVMLAVAGMADSAYAQDNPQRINDRYYPMYVRAYNLRKSPACLPIADSLRVASVASGDHYGEVYALSIPLLYESYLHDNLDGVNRAVKPLQEKANEYGLKVLYYYSVSLKVAYLTRERRYIEAFLYLNQQSELAEKQGDIDGILLKHRMLGVIQHFRGELSQAVSCYRDAIEGYRKYGRPRYISREYLSIADCYRMMGNYEQLLATADEAWQYCVMQSDRNNVCIYKAYANFMLGRDSDFVECCDYLDKNRGVVRLDNSFIIMNNALKACRAIYDRRDDEAKRLIGIVAKSSVNESYRLLIAYYKCRSDYAKCIEYMQKIIDARFINEDEIMVLDNNSVDSMFLDQHVEAERQRIISRNNQLRLDNLNMSLANSSLELAQRRNALALAEADDRRNRLLYNNQQLVARQLRDSIATARLTQLAKERRMRMERFVAVTIILIALAVMVVMLIYVFLKRLFANRLREANAQLNESIDKLNVAKDKAQESERMKTLFIQNMSHEIRTPLNAIVGFSQFVTDSDNGLNSSEKKEMARYIADNSELLVTLVNDIIDISALQSGKFNMNMEEVNINRLCREALETVRHRLQPNVSLSYQTGVEDAFCIVTDRHRVWQVLINMLTNAEKNTSSGSIVLACSAASLGCLRFTVTDTGVGVPKERHKEIFTRYQKLDANKQGTGLGLDICRSIAHGLGGEIDIDSDYNGGARFWFTIPLSR